MTDKQPVNKPDVAAKTAKTPNNAAPTPMPDITSILALQGLIGNHAVQRRMIQRDGTGTIAALPKPAVPDPLTIHLTSEQYAKCDAIFKSKPSWSALKTQYIDGGDLQTMAELWAFRRKYVVDLLLALRAGKYANLLGKSAGSTDLSSDYDITIASPGNDNDVKAIDDFNNAVKADFGVQPGTLFDTNLYAKDFLPISQSDEFKGEGSPADVGQTPIASIVDVENDTQDVGALLKQRRYMTQPEWDKFVEDLVRSLAPDKRAAVRRKYDEADATYQICVATLLTELRGDVTEEQQDADLEAAQENNAEELHEATEENSDKVLEKSNQLYLGRMSMIRSIQANIAALESKQANLSTLESISAGFGSFLNRLFKKPDKGLNAQIEAQKAQIKQLLSEAIYFAAEAYTSEGAIKHVVAGIQGGRLTDEEKAKPKEEQNAILARKRKEANDKLTISELLQSFNEQLGDFLKDYGHLSHGTAGNMYIKSSKYVDRMLDCMLILQDRKLVKFPKVLGIESAMGKPLPTIVAQIKALVGARKDPNLWADKREETSVGVMTGLNMRDIETYKAALLQLGVEMNGLIRNSMTSGADTQQELTYMQNRNTAFD